MIKVSVVIPIYNMEKYIRQCLDSILSQTLKEIELVCIDDGSKDSSAKIVNEYARNDSRVKLIVQENQGVGKTRNKGINLSQGKYIAFMDPDDYYPDNEVLNDLFMAAERKQVLVCGGSLCEDHEDGKWFQKSFRGNIAKQTFREEQLVPYRDYQFDFGFYRFIYNRKFLLENDIYFPPYIRFQDPPFFVNAMIHAGSFYAMPRITYCYRVGHQNFVWDEKRVCAVLSGCIDNLVMSKEAELPELHRLTLERLLYEFKDVIFVGLELKSKDVLRLLLKADSSIVPSYVEKYSDYKDGIIPLLYEWNNWSQQYRTEDAALEAMRKSKTSKLYRVYNKVKKIPRKLRKILTRYLNK